VLVADEQRRRRKPFEIPKLLKFFDREARLQVKEQGDGPKRAKTHTQQRAL
jgi:hypothetical protein